ncbi:MAG: hypothetical protein NT129_00855 [Candidatus Aenigmarchaeota archaeon]|nr:hypothetical protein [Candidatus Aenigmarchaeota archaeon]
MKISKRVALVLPILFLLVLVSISYAVETTSSNSIVATVTVLKPSSSIDIDFFLGFFYGQLKNNANGKGLINKPVKLTVQYSEYSHGNLQLKTATYDLETGYNGYWYKWFGFNWKYAKIEFAGDATAGPASAAIGTLVTTTTTTTTTSTTTTTKPCECKEDAYRCNLNKLEICDDGKWIFVKSCLFGCSNKECNPPSTTSTTTSTTTTLPPKRTH